MGQTTHKTNFSPNPVQRQFITSQATADLFSSRRGEGKSVGLAWSCLYHTRHNPGADWAFVRDTFENIQRTTMKTFFEWFPPGVYGTYHHTKHQFTWAEGVASGTVTFIGMDDPSRASAFQSWELGGIAMDEPAPATDSGGIDEMVFDLGMTSLRQPGMKWYAMKLAENNPDESHWTYRKFVDPGREGYLLWQPNTPENVKNLPSNYYEQMRAILSHRPDLVRRFVEGEFGFQQIGQAVTPQWNDHIHLANGLFPLPGRELILLWDFGHNPTCIITQITPLGHWVVLDAFVGEGIGVEELIEEVVKPRLTMRYPRAVLRHIGDPSGSNRDQSSIKRSAVKVLKAALGGTWRPGPIKWHERRDAIQSVLSRTIGGRGLLLVDRQWAKPLWWALRGGWHYHVARTGLVSAEPKKDLASHPGDAISYGAAVLFPPGRLMKQKMASTGSAGSGYFGPQQVPRDASLGPGGQGPNPGLLLPENGAQLRGEQAMQNVREMAQSGRWI